MNAFWFSFEVRLGLLAVCVPIIIYTTGLCCRSCFVSSSSSCKAKAMKGLITQKLLCLLNLTAVDLSLVEYAGIIVSQDLISGSM